MKRLSLLWVCVLSVVLALPAQAHGLGHGGGYGRHGGYGYRGGWSNPWVGPVLGAAIVGGAIYAASTPSYAMTPTVVVQQYVPPSRVAYFCPTAQQYYPTVPTCQVPWQAVTY